LSQHPTTPINQQQTTNDLNREKKKKKKKRKKRKMGELPPLLRLPPPLRRRIYGFVGLASSDSTNPYKFDLHGCPLDPPVLSASTFHGLLLSYRTIYAEAAAIVYSRNLFILRFDPAYPEPLRPLNAPTPIALVSLM
jgi:hypothetical protein